MENRTARMTILVDPRKKEIFERLCAKQDLTPSQVVRKLIRQYIIDNTADKDLPPWLMARDGPSSVAPGSMKASKTPRSRSR